MSYPDDLLPIAADYIDLLEAAATRNVDTAISLAHRMEDQYGSVALIVMASFAAGLIKGNADACGRDIADVIADMRRRAAA